MLVEVKLECAGAAALIAQCVGAKIDEVYTTYASVTLMLNEDLVQNRAFMMACERQMIIYKDY